MIVIGAGIAGLVCANYLAKKGFKVTVIEQHYFVGGCCSHYRRHGFIFDVGVHYLGNLREGGFMNRLLSELGVLEKLNISRIDPTDLIVFPDRKIVFHSDSALTLFKLQEQFPKEAGALERFFCFLKEENLLILAAKTKGKSFRHILRSFFKDDELIGVFCVLLGNIGLPSDELSGITGVILYRDYILDGGYYPRGGTHKLAEILTQNLKDMGGNIWLKKTVTKIEIENGKIRGVRLGNNEVIESKMVVAAIDARQVMKLISLQESENMAASCSIRKMIPSVSAFIVYLGLKAYEGPRENCANIWYCTDYDIDQVYRKAYSEGILDTKRFVYCSFPSLIDSSLAPAGFEAAHVLILTPANLKGLKAEDREAITERLLLMAEKVRPHLRHDIVIKEPATPSTIERFTGNLGGSIYGWASTNSSVGGEYEVPQRTEIGGLFLCGHWVTKPTGQGGVTMAAYSGRRAAQLVQRSSKSKMLFIN